MPLRKCSSQNCFSRNVSQLMKEGYEQKQALAISYDVKRKAIAKKTAKSRKKK